jgi:hypothetical protein
MPTDFGSIAPRWQGRYPRCGKRGKKAAETEKGPYVTYDPTDLEHLEPHSVPNRHEIVIAPRELVDHEISF